MYNDTQVWSTQPNTTKVGPAANTRPPPQNLALPTYCQYAWDFLPNSVPHDWVPPGCLPDEDQGAPVI